jgi:hypothetical protein
MTLRDDITAALAAAPETDFHFVRIHSFQNILDRIAELFLKEGRRDLAHLWLWECFRNILTSSHPDDSVSALKSRLQPEERYWFLASDGQGKYWVADATGAGILNTLRELYRFEYYVVNRHMTWLIFENHHGVLMEASADAPTAKTTKNYHQAQQL